jgi:chain length determinant protein tyrosine kinase EpsG
MTTIDNLVHIESHAHGNASDTAPGADSVGAILMAAGKITARDVARIMELQQREGWRFGEAALRLRLINERDLVLALNKQYDVPELRQGNGGASAELVTAFQQYHPRTEELRALRTQLLVRWFRRPGVDQNVLTVVSPGAGEGRSYVAANLAVLFSQLGVRTLLIDADLRNPRQHRIFRIPDRIGLGAVLAGRADAHAAIAVPGCSNLLLLPAGEPPPNPLELLSRPAMPALLKTYLANFDVILVDTPPALLYSDAQAVSFRAGSAIVLARKDRTPLAQASQVVRDLLNNGTRVVGTVINAH